MHLTILWPTGAANVADKSFDVVAYGHALLDVQARVSHRFVSDLDLQESTQQLVGAAQAAWLYERMRCSARESSGGSAANSAAIVAALGGKAGFMGRVGADWPGDVFTNDLQAQGVSFVPRVRNVADGDTGRCLVLVTPDGKRTMSTCLGAANKAGMADLDARLIARSRFLLIEGYMFDTPENRGGTEAAMKMAKDSGTKIALTLSAENCIERHRDVFCNLVKEVDVVLANDAEVMSLYRMRDIDSALTEVAKHASLAAITRGAAGAAIVSKNSHIHIPALPGVHVVDTTGAGDAFAGGFLYGLAQGKTPLQVGRMATLCAAEIISHMGARPEQNLKSNVARGLRTGLRAQTTRSVPAKPHKPV